MKVEKTNNITTIFTAYIGNTDESNLNYLIRDVRYLNMAATRRKRSNGKKIRKPQKKN